MSGEGLIGLPTSDIAGVLFVAKMSRRKKVGVVVVVFGGRQGVEVCRGCGGEREADVGCRVGGGCDGRVGPRQTRVGVVFRRVCRVGGGGGVKNRRF